MTQTATAITAARVNRNDVVEIDGQKCTVLDYETLPGRIRWILRERASVVVTPTRIVTAWI